MSKQKREEEKKVLAQMEEAMLLPGLMALQGLLLLLIQAM